MSGCASIFRLSPIETKEEDVAKKLLNSMRVTSACRFNASNRLEWQGKMSFVLTTILSLGLILIPLLQNSGVELRFECGSDFFSSICFGLLGDNWQVSI